MIHVHVRRKTLSQTQSQASSQVVSGHLRDSTAQCSLSLTSRSRLRIQARALSLLSPLLHCPRASNRAPVGALRSPYLSPSTRHSPLHPAAGTHMGVASTGAASTGAALQAPQPHSLCAIALPEPRRRAARDPRSLPQETTRSLTPRVRIEGTPPEHPAHYSTLPSMMSPLTLTPRSALLGGVSPPLPTLTPSPPSRAVCRRSLATRAPRRRRSSESHPPPEGRKIDDKATDDLVPVVDRAHSTRATPRCDAERARAPRRALIKTRRENGARAL